MAKSPVKAEGTGQPLQWLKPSGEDARPVFQKDRQHGLLWTEEVRRVQLQHT